MILKNAFIQLPDRLIYGYIKTKHHKIVNVFAGEYTPNETCKAKGCPCEEEVIDCQGHLILPGFIDPMVHGGFGHAFLSAKKIDILDYCQKVAQSGVTSFCAATITNDWKNILSALDTISSYMEEYQNDFNYDRAKIIGINTEGPFLSKKFRGVHPVKYLIEPTIELVQEMEKASRNKIKIMPMAIENADVKLAQYLYKNEIVLSLAHSNANLDKVAEFIYEGFLGYCTHLYNGMSRFGHRELGCVNACLMFDEILCELIADGVHVNNELLQFTLDLKTAANIAFVTDATMAAGMPDGPGYELAGMDVDKIGNRVVISGTKEELAGSANLMCCLVKNMFENTDASPYELMLMSSTNIARKLNIDHEVGTISANYIADLVVLDSEYNVKATIINGKIAYNNL